MKDNSVKKLTLAGILSAFAVIGSLISFPIFGSKCAPVQHFVNIIAAVFLGPWYALGIAFVSSLLRNLLSLGTVLAFPGSIFGAFIAGLVFKKTKNIILTCFGESFGTGIIGALFAYPLARLFFGKMAGDIAFYSYIIPFLISTIVGSVIAGVIILGLEKSKIVNLHLE
ncbi:MAG: energy coupling factor transporter S component ThiW [Tissierellia bacterium]|nr:energy coupling factor transporter S component ThiW [Tissierellia bacterium]